MIWFLILYWPFVAFIVDNWALKILLTAIGLIIPMGPYVLGCEVICFLIFKIISHSFENNETT